MEKPSKTICRKRIRKTHFTTKTFRYLKELVDDGLVKKTVDVPAMMFRMYWRAYPIYVVPKNKRNKIQQIRTKKRIYEFVDNADPKEIEQLQKEIDKIK